MSTHTSSDDELADLARGLNALREPEPESSEARRARMKEKRAAGAKLSMDPELDAIATQLAEG